MSISSRLTILDRAQSATEESPLALFKTTDGIDCVFASTIESQARVVADPGYLATVHKGMQQRAIATILRESMT